MTLASSAVSFGHVCVSFLFLVRRPSFQMCGVPCSITSQDSRDGITRFCALSTAAARRPRFTRGRKRAHSFYCWLMIHTGVGPVYPGE